MSDGRAFANAGRESEPLGCKSVHRDGFVFLAVVVSTEDETDADLRDFDDLALQLFGPGLLIEDGHA